MKFLKYSSNLLLNILQLILGVILVTYAIWYIIPAFQSTRLGLFLNPYLTYSLWILIGSGILYLIITILSKILFRRCWSKFNNFFLHLNTTIYTLVCIGLTIYTFAVVSPLISNPIEITQAKKIGIGICLILLVIFYTFAPKLLKIINRRIQAYENAKEMNILGRGSVVLTNFLKLFEILFPGFIILTLLCLCISWSVACYFILIIASTIFIVIGNIEADFNVRREIKYKNTKQEQELIEKIANKVRSK